MKTYLTKTGNILVATEQKAFFANASFNFLRNVSEAELEHLLTTEMPEIVFPEKEQGKLSNMNTPEWVYLFTLESQDLNKYNPDTCFNGGGYGISHESAFFGRFNGGNYEFCKLDTEHCTTTDFPNDDFGNWNEYKRVHIADVDIDMFVRDSRTNLEEAPLARYAQPCTIDTLLTQREWVIEQGGEEKEYTLITYANYLQRWRYISEALNASPFTITGRETPTAYIRAFRKLRKRS